MSDIIIGDFVTIGQSDLTWEVIGRERFTTVTSKPSAERWDCLFTLKSGQSGRICHRLGSHIHLHSHARGPAKHVKHQTVIDRLLERIRRWWSYDLLYGNLDEYFRSRRDHPAGKRRPVTA